MKDISHPCVWSAHILSLFPDMFPGPLGHSLAGRALAQGIWSLHTHNIRDFAADKHSTVDDPPFGGGHGMVMRPDVVGKALDHVTGIAPDFMRLYPSPRGVCLDQPLVREMSRQKGVVIVCGRYEGLDQRVIDHYQLKEVSIGDYILSGGEQAALVILDAIIRLLPGVMGKEISHQQESFEQGLLEHDHYTQPRSWNDREPPDILLSGHHKNIAQWRLQNARQRTADRRPDLWARYEAKKHAKHNDND